MIPTPRTPVQVQAGMLAVQPDGMAAGHDPDTFLAARYLPAADAFASIEASVLSMLPQVDPRSAPNLLPDFERMLGPDPCQVGSGITDTQTLANIAWARLTNSGTICAGYFERLAAAIGETITIGEFFASMCGLSVCGASVCNPPPGHLQYLVTLPTRTVVTAICGIATCGDSLGAFDLSVMECVIRNEAPLFAQPTFSYTG